MSTMKTYADGFGRWHAIVPDTPRALTKAVNAIAEEIMQRENVSRSDVVAYLHQNIITEPSDNPGKVHFIEYALPEESR